jgi:hypothetical protein
MLQERDLVFKGDCSLLMHCTQLLLLALDENTRSSGCKLGVINQQVWQNQLSKLTQVRYSPLPMLGRVPTRSLASLRVKLDVAWGCCDGPTCVTSNTPPLLW